MHGLKPALLTLLYTLVSACASNGLDKNIDYAQDVDFAAMKTYRWYGDAHPSEKDSFRRYNDSYKRMRGTIDKALTAKGYREADSGNGDFMVNYNVSQQDQVKIDNFAAYNGGGLHGGVSTGTLGSSVAIGYTSQDYGVRKWKEGTLVIDIIQSSTNKVVWRGIAEGRLPKEYSLSSRKEIVNEAVNLLIDDFPPYQ